MTFDVGIRAGFLLSMKKGLGAVDRDSFIGIRGDQISEVTSFRSSCADESATFLDLKDQIVMPGLINAHTHLAMSLFRGFEDDVPFHEWLFNRIFPLEAEKVDSHFVRVGVELSALECIRFGTTFVNDMYFFAETTAEVLDRAGLRGYVAWPFMDFPVPDEKLLGSTALATRPERFKSFYSRYQNHPRIMPALGPHAPYTCADSLLLQVRDLSLELGAPIHMHVAETAKEVSESRDQHGKSPVKRLSDLGLLSNRFFGAHGIHLDSQDREILRASGATIIYNPDSNLKLGSGVADIPGYRKLGIPVALGTDGAASNNDLSLFGAMDLGTKIQKWVNHDTTAMVALDALNLATYEGAAALGLQDQIGSIEVGKKADLISLRTDLPHVKPLYSVLSQLVYAYQGLEVDTTLCGGRILQRDGRCLTLDSERIYQEVEALRTEIRVNGTR